MPARNRIHIPRLLFALVLLLCLSADGCSQNAAARAPSPTRALFLADPTASPAPVAEATLPAQSSAQSSRAGYPERPITFMIPWAPGGPLDVGVRTMYAFLEPEFGQPMQVVYKPGATGQVGLTEFVRDARPDGYTLTALNSPNTESSYLDPARRAVYSRSSFAPIAAQVYDPNVYFVRSDSPYHTISDLLEAARKSPRSVISGDGGLMSDDHMSLLRFQKLTGVEFCMSHFDGGAPTQAALYGGHIEIMVGNIGDAMGGYRAGAFRVLGIAAEERSPMLPDVPTLREQGIDLVTAVVRGWAAPAGTPANTLTTVEAAMKRVDAMPAYRERMFTLGLPIRFMDGVQYSRYLEAEEKRVEELLKELR